MVPQAEKIVAITLSETITDAASLTTAEVDTSGFDYADVYFYLGTTDIAVTALAVTQSDSSGSGHANVTGLIWGTSSNIAGSTSTLPTATDDDNWFKFEIDLRGKKRYLDFTITFGDGTLGGWGHAFCILKRAKHGPVSASEKGVQEVLRA